MPGPYLSPGVYVEEVPPAARPIAGVGTSTAGFIGVVANAVKMPDQPGRFKTDAEGKYELDANGKPIPIPYEVAEVGKPKLITSWEEFKTKFGDFHADNKTLAHAVFGFFNNGGSRCWVIRVATDADLNNLDEELLAFETIDEIAIVAVPGATTQEQHNDLLGHCLKLQDRVAILDGVQQPTVLTPARISPAGRSEAGSYGAIYFPWIQIFDPVTTAVITVPPSGHIAGIYARSDANRGVHKAPANEVVLGTLGLERRISKAQQDGVNPDGINVIREFNGTIKVWGARTRADEAHSEFRYISTRRFFNFLRESIDEGTQFVVFEPNNSALWERIKRSVGDFLLNQWRAGALFGETPKQAFFVRCDKETNAGVTELGQVVTEIGVAIVKPAEFVIFRIQQTTGG
jgi:phage tail sheath protein FI